MMAGNVSAAAAISGGLITDMSDISATPAPGGQDNSTIAAVLAQDTTSLLSGNTTVSAANDTTAPSTSQWGSTVVSGDGADQWTSDSTVPGPHSSTLANFSLDAFTNASWTEHLTSVSTAASSALPSTAPGSSSSPWSPWNTTSPWPTTTTTTSVHPSPTNGTAGGLLTVEEGEAEAPRGSEVKELVYVVIVIAFYSAALLALVVLQIRRYYTRHSNYTSFSGQSADATDGYDLYEEYSEHRQLIFQESRRADTENKVKRIQGVHNGYNIDAIPEHVV